MRDIWLIAAIGSGGAIGAIARYTISSVARRQLGTVLPWGTLLANLVGCLAIGCVLTLAENSVKISPIARAALVTGLLGALTTFSTFGWETFAATQNHQFGLALVNIAANVVLGLAAVWLGSVIALQIVAYPNPLR